MQTDRAVMVVFHHFRVISKAVKNELVENLCFPQGKRKFYYLPEKPNFERSKKLIYVKRTSSLEVRLLLKTFKVENLCFPYGKHRFL